MSLTTVLGPPGTGKTTYLAKQIERAVDRFGPEKVLVASLTKTAAVEIASRGLTVARENVGTLHALAYRALGRPTMFSETDFSAATSYALTPVSAETVEPGGTDDDKARARIDLLRMQGADMSLLPSALEGLYQAMVSWKQATGTVDFTDMITQCIDQVPVHPSNPRAIFYDEAQDGSVVELRLLRQWGAHCDHTIIVGDDMQVLYQWRGASVTEFLSFSERKIVLSTSYRLPRAVWKYAMRWRDLVHTRADAKFAPREDAPEGEVRHSQATSKRPHAAIRYIRENPDRQIMILAACNHMLYATIKALKEASIPFHNPFRVRQGAWNPLARGKRAQRPADRVLAYLQTSVEWAGDDARPWTWRELHAWVDVLNASVLPRGGKTRIAKQAKEMGDEIVPYGELETLVGVGAVEEAESGNLRWFAENTMKAKAERMTYPVQIAHERGIKGLLTEPRVIVGTIHSVKGAEAQDVILYPDLSPAAFRDYHGGDRDARDAVLRQFYVGLTRARERLLLAQRSGIAVQWLEVSGK